MTYEEALNKLDETFIGNLELKAVLSQALKNKVPQIPKYLGEKTIRKSVFGCPNCNEPVGFKQQYCAYCGQKINWLDEVNDYD